MKRKCIDDWGCDIRITEQDICCIECELRYNCNKLCSNLTEDNVCMVEHPSNKEE